jgi:hypothetical protein
MISNLHLNFKEEKNISGEGLLSDFLLVVDLHHQRD